MRLETTVAGGKGDRSTPLGVGLNGERINPEDELGLTGLKAVSGYVDEEFLPALKGPKAAKVYREMSDNDPVIGAGLHAIDMLLRGVEWRFETNETESEEANAAADFARECQGDMEHTWEEFISEVLTAAIYGYSLFEPVYKKRQGDTGVVIWEPEDVPNMRREAPDHPPSSKYDDGRYGWHKFAPRSQDSVLFWDVDASGVVRGVWTQPPPTWERIYLPMTKLLHFRTSARKGNPEGRSMLRNAYRPWYFKKRLEEIEGIGIERDLAGLPVAWIPAQYLAEEATDDEKFVASMFEQAVRDTRRDAQEGLVLPMQYDENGNRLYEFTLLSSGGTRTFNTDAIIQRYDQRILMTLLADILLIGHEAVGSYALSTSKEGMLRASLTALLDLVAEVFNRVELPRLWRINNMDPDTMPVLVHGEVDTPSPAELAGFIATLSGAGMPFFPNQELENQLLETAKLPTRTEEEWRALYDAQQAQMEMAQQGFGEEVETYGEEVPPEEVPTEEEDKPRESLYARRMGQKGEK